MKEYFDVYDKNRNFLNRQLERGTILEKNEFNTGVELWLINDNNEILMTQRSKDKSHPFMWECPGGCSIAGENTKDTLIREAKEEIGLDLTNEFSLIGTDVYKHQFVDIFKVHKNLPLGKIKLQKEEVINVKYVTIDEFEKMCQNDEIVPSVINRYNIIKKHLIK